jgi:iron complex outermembrane receptor protein
LAINVSGAYIDAGYDDVGKPAVGPGGPSLTLDTPFQRTPEYSYTFGASYNDELANGNLLSITADYGWKDKMANNDSATGGFFLPSYGLLNARIGLVVGDSGWELALVGTNLLDEEYLTGGFDPSTRENIGGFVQHDLGRPREYGLEVSYKF